MFATSDTEVFIATFDTEDFHEILFSGSEMRTDV